MFAGSRFAVVLIFLMGAVFAGCLSLEGRGPSIDLSDGGGVECVPDPDTPTWNNSIHAIVLEKCSECHSSDDTEKFLPSLTTYDDVKLSSPNS